MRGIPWHQVHIMGEWEWDEGNGPGLGARGRETKASSSESVTTGGRENQPEWEGSLQSEMRRHV